MPQSKNPRKLGFPGISDEQYKLYHERLVRAEKTTKVSIRASMFKKTADGLLPGWDGK